MHLLCQRTLGGKTELTNGPGTPGWPSIPRPPGSPCMSIALSTRHTQAHMTIK